jgi:hypothetical protein
MALCRTSATSQWYIVIRDTLSDLQLAFHEEIVKTLLTELFGFVHLCRFDEGDKNTLAGAKTQASAPETLPRQKQAPFPHR